MLRARLICLTLVLSCAAAAAPGQTLRATPRSEETFREDFEGAQFRLALLECDGPYRIESHQLAAAAHTGYQCEQFQIELGQGNKCYLGLTTSRALVIEELAAGIFIKCSRPGAQILGRVVLPNTVDPRSGGPATILVVGSAYTDAGRWQPLRLTRIPDQVAQAARGLQTQYGPGARIDIREAYLDYLAINVHTGPGRLAIAVDDVELSGIVSVGGQSSLPVLVPPQVGGAPPNGTSTLPSLGSRRLEIRSQGSQLVAGGRALFVRAVQYQGEPLEFLQGLGFNAVQLRAPASEMLLGEAARLGLWVIGPPPHLTAQSATNQSADVQLGPQWDPILAWDVGTALTSPQFEEFCQQVRLLRQADRNSQTVARPILCDPLTDCRTFSRHADILRPSRSPIGSTLELADFGTWLRERTRLARPGMPLWTTIQTQPAAEWAMQVRTLTGADPVGCIAVEQLRLLTGLAVASGARGLIFESRSRLDGQDTESRRRAMSLELVNLELSLIEPWAAAGTPLTVVNSSEPRVIAGLLQAEKAHLLIPLWLAPGSQFVAGQAAATNLAVIVPGVPPAHDGYELTPTSMQRIDQRRVTRGVRVTIPDFGVASQVVFTADPIVLRSLQDRVGRVAPRAAKLQQDLAHLKLMSVEELHQKMTAAGRLQPVGTQYVALARSLLQQAETSQRGSLWEKSYRSAERGTRPLRLLERTYWEESLQGLSPVSNPLSCDASTLPWHAALDAQLRGAKWSPNLLPAGDCEDVNRMRAAGWRLSQHPSSGVNASGAVAAGNAHAGQFGVRLLAAPTNPRSPPTFLDSPATWLTTPVVQVPVGSIVRIHGYTRTPAPITSSVDGLMVFDSLGGPALAQRIDAAPSGIARSGVANAWQEFTLIRAAPPEMSRDGRAVDVVITFALTGLGEAWIDDVTIEWTPPSRVDRVATPPATSAR